MTTDIPHGPQWLAYLAEQTGTDKWVVAARLTNRLKDKGYTLALSQARYTGLQEAFNALQAQAKAFNVALALFPREADHMASDPAAWRAKIQAVRLALTAQGLL